MDNEQKVELTDKQRIFIAEYCINGFNGVKAAISAGYSENSCHSIAGENLSKPIIRQAIKDYVNEILLRYKNTLEYEIIQTYKIRAFYNTEDILTKDGALAVDDLKQLGELTKCIDGIETRYTATGIKNTIIKLANKESALNQLAKYMNIIKENIDLNVNAKIENIDFSNISEEDAEKLYDELHK